MPEQTVVSDLPKQSPNKSETKTKEPTNATKGIAIVHVPNESSEEERLLSRCKTTNSKQLSQHKIAGTKNFRVFFSEKQRTQQKQEEERLSRECSRKKCKKKQQCAIYRGTGPRKAKRPNKLSLKRHAAWEYLESAARRKSLFWLPHPHLPRGPFRRRDLFKFQKASYFLTSPFFGKIGKLKRGAM